MIMDILFAEGRKPLTVRLIGVDAPEVDGPYRKAEFGGVEARSFVGSLLSGRPVYLALMMNAEGVLRLKPQNLLVNLPLRASM